MTQRHEGVRNLPSRRGRPAGFFYQNKNAAVMYPTAAQDWVRYESLIRTKSTAIFSRVDEDEDHVTQVVGIRVQRVDVVLIADCVRVAPLKTEVQDRHSSFRQKSVEGCSSLGDAAQDLSVGL